MKAIVAENDFERFRAGPAERDDEDQGLSYPCALSLPGFPGTSVSFDQKEMSWTVRGRVDVGANRDGARKRFDEAVASAQKALTEPAWEVNESEPSTVAPENRIMHFRREDGKRWALVSLSYFRHLKMYQLSVSVYPKEP